MSPNATEFYSGSPAGHSSGQGCPPLSVHRDTAPLHQLGYITLRRNTHPTPDMWLEHGILPCSGWPWSLTSQISVWLTKPTPELYNTRSGARMEGKQPAGPRDSAEDLYPCYGGPSGAKTKGCYVLPPDLLTLPSHFLPPALFPW